MEMDGLHSWKEEYRMDFGFKTCMSEFGFVHWRISHRVSGLSFFNLILLIYVVV